MEFERLFADGLQSVQVVDSRADRKSLVDEGLCRAENEIAVRIMLEMLVGLIADPHGTVADGP